MRQCDNCRFFVEHFYNTWGGDCKRYPIPVVVKRTHECGEYRPNGNQRFLEKQMDERV